MPSSAQLAPAPAVHQSAGRMHLLMLLVTVCWAINIIAGKMALTGFNVLALAQLRMLATAVIFAVAYAAKQRTRPVRWSPRKWPFLVAMAAVSIALNQLTFIDGMKFTSVANTSLIVALGPVMVLAIAVAIRFETLSAWKFVGMLVAFAGVAILTLDSTGQGSGGHWKGDLITLASTFIFAVYTILVKAVADQYDSLTMNTLIFVLAAILMLPFCAHATLQTNWSRASWQAWWGLGFLVLFGSVLSYLLFSYVMTEMAASRAAAFNYLQPLIAIALGIWLLSERLTGKVLAGGALILAGVYLAEREQDGAKG